MDPATLTARLEEATGLSLEAPERLRQGRATTLRYRVTGGRGPERLIVKLGDPVARSFRREAAALRVLPACATAHAHVPRLLHDLAGEGVLVIEDVSPAEPLEDRIVLSATDGTEDARADMRHGVLLRVAEALGELHGSARAAAGSLDHSADAKPAYQLQAQALRRAVSATRAFVDALVPDVGSRLEASLERLADSVDGDQPRSTITVGDMAPSNVLLDDSRVTFVDFEYAGVRHPFYDAMFWRCIVPFPPDIADAMEARYRTGLSAHGYELDDETFYGDMTRMASHRLFWMLSWNMLELLERDRPVVTNGPGLRSTLLSHFDQLERLARRASFDGTLERIAERCRMALHSRWSERAADSRWRERAPAATRDR